MGDKFYAMRSGRILCMEGHPDIEGARDAVRRSAAEFPRRLHEIVMVVEEHENLRGECVVCGHPFDLKKKGTARRHCDKCTHEHDKKRSRENHYLRKIREYRREQDAKA